MKRYIRSIHTMLLPILLFIPDFSSANEIHDVIAENPLTNETWIVKRIKKTNVYYHGIIIKTSHEYDIEPSLIKAVILAESGFRKKTVSRTGAQGLMQLMPGTAKALSVKNAFNPENNITGGVKHLKYLLDRCSGDLDMALAAYNAGMSNVNKYKGIPPYKETINYIKRVREYKKYYELVMSNSI